MIKSVEAPLIIEPIYIHYKGHTMNGTTTMWLGMTATFFFTIGMISYNVKHLFKQQKAVQGVVLALDNIRYILMFISFMATISLLVHAGAIALDNYTLSTTESIVALVFIGSFAILASLAISGTLLWTERAFGEGGLTKQKNTAIILAFACVALLDTTSISKGYASISNELESKKIKELDTSKNVNTSLIMDTKRDIVLSLKQQLQDVSTEIANVGTLSIIPTKRIRELKAQIKSYEKRGKACPNTKAKLAALEQKTREKKLEGLAASRSKLQGKLFSITKDFESTTTASEVAKSKAVAEIKKEAQNNQVSATLIAFLGMLLAISLSVIRSILIKDEEVEEESKEVSREQTTAQEKRHYIFQAMKDKARRLEMSTDRGTERLSFGRDDMAKKAKYIAGRENKILSYSSEEILPIIGDFKQKGGELESWLVTQSWNMFPSDDPHYQDDLVAS